MKLGENIYKYRTLHGLSQGDLADAVEVSRQSVSKWENDSATPELEKLIKLAALFDITLDELVFGEPRERPVGNAVSAKAVSRFYLPVRTWVGAAMLLFGMIFFLLSVFWGDHLRIGEEAGELISLCIVLISIAFLGTFNAGVFSGCAVIYFLYAVTCVCLNVRDTANNLFIFLTGFVILIWFILLGQHATRKTSPKRSDGDQAS